MNRLPARVALLLLAATLLPACRGMYYSALGRMGQEKRDILVSRIEKSREAQDAAKQQFQSALEAFEELTAASVDAELESKYAELEAQYERADARANAVRERIQSIKTVAGDLFEEWALEIERISSPTLQTQERDRMQDARARYDELVVKMDAAEASMAPVLTALNDRILVLKSMLNAEAIRSLRDTVFEVNDDVIRLVAMLQASIDEADEFLAAMSS